MKNEIYYLPICDVVRKTTVVPRVIKVFSGLKIISSKSMEVLKEVIANDIDDQLKILQCAVYYIGELCPITILFLFLQAILFRRGYLRKLNYENFFITRKFIEYDKQQSEKDKKLRILPLKKKEKSKYCYENRCILHYTKKELRAMVIPIIAFVCCLLIGFIIYFGDYCLFLLLSNLQSNFNREVLISANYPLELKDDNVNFIIRDIFKNLYDGLNIKEKNITINTTNCLYDYHKPSFRGENFGLIVGLYCLYFILVIFHPIGLRLQRKIMSLFYIEQEHRRIVYLHNQIRVKRYNFVYLIKKRLENENSVKLSDWFKLKFPLLFKLCCFCCKNYKICDICSKSEKQIINIVKYNVCHNCKLKLINSYEIS